MLMESWEDPEMAKKEGEGETKYSANGTQHVQKWSPLSPRWIEISWEGSSSGPYAVKGVQDLSLIPRLIISIVMRHDSWRTMIRAGMRD